MVKKTIGFIELYFRSYYKNKSDVLIAFLFVLTSAVACRCQPIEDELEQQEQQMMIEPPVQVVQHRTVQRHVADDSWDEFADFDTDLQVPDGLEGPQEVFTTAGD